jgi:hypothetical protein
MCNRDLDETWARKDEFPAYREALEQLNGFAYDPRMEDMVSADIEHDMSKPGPSGGKGILAGLAVMSFSAVAVVAAIGWLATLFWEGLIKRFVDAIAFFLLLAVWLAVYAVLNPAEAATFMGETDVPAFSIYVLVVLAPICIAGVLAVAIIDKRKVRR